MVWANQSRNCLAKLKLKTVRFPLVLLAFLVVLFVSYILSASSSLPSHIATHFDLKGQPNGWMSRSAHIRFTVTTGLGMTAFFVGLFYGTRFLPVSLINIPRRDYWLSTENRAATNDFIFRSGLWFACLIILFHSAIYHIIIQANSVTPPRLPSSQFFSLTIGFIVCIIFWCVSLFRHFWKTDLPARPS